MNRQSVPINSHTPQNQAMKRNHNKRAITKGCVMLKINNDEVIVK